jgi:hypothetical protein
MNPDISSRPHFHIRWHGQTLDWECFESREEAEERAAFLKRDGETFAIEEVNVCPARAKLVAKMNGSVG